MKPKVHEDFDDEEAMAEFEKTHEQAKGSFGRFNLLIMGNSGVGKSSLINAVFKRKVAATGIGMPVTRGLKFYSDESLGIWDSEGFESGTRQTPVEAVREHLETIRARPDEEQISAIWYCVLSTAHRLTDADVEVIRELAASGYPVILVLTKVAWAINPVTRVARVPESVQEFLDWLESPERGEEPVDLPVTIVVPTSSQGRGSRQSLKDLVEQTLDFTPSEGRDSFRMAQMVDVQMKRRLARPVVAAATTAAAAAAASPIPGSDAATLAPIQLGMMARLSAIYGLSLRTMLSSQALAQLAVQIAGRATARSLIKLIPGAGHVINAAVAAALTYAAGECWMRLCEAVFTGKIDGPQLADAISDYLPTISDVLKAFVTSRTRFGSETPSNGTTAD